jgi:hypothetical protein
LNECSLRPLFRDFEDSGVTDALIRLCRGMSQEFDVPGIPLWVSANRIADVSDLQDKCVSMVEEARSVVAALHALECQLASHLNPGEAGGSSVEGPSNLSPVSSVMLARLLLGSCCEMYASLQCSRLCKVGDRPARKRDTEETLRLYKDSFLAAVWTSAHAQCISDRIGTSVSEFEPTIHTVPSELGEMDLSDLYARRTCPRSLYSKDAAHLLQLMTRCTNPGARG